jgi:hypothetical protein
MGIFCGSEILFFTLGAITATSVFYLIYLTKKYTLGWKTYILAIFGIFLIVFCFAWTVSSLLEGEQQAASMGLLLIGFPFLVIFGIFRRVLTSAYRRIKA